MEKQIYNLTTKQALESFNSSFFGISEEEAKRRMENYGSNQLKDKISWKWLKLILGQFNDALVWILLVAGALSFIFKEFRDTYIIMAIILINAAIGFFQEYKAEKILDKIKKLKANKALVIRNRKKREIDSKYLVPGDIVYLKAGDNVPADGYLLESYNLKVNSFIFTGESKPKKREVKTISNLNVHQSDIDNMVLMGESVAVGEAVFLVTGTGMKTKLGKIARITQTVADDPTPLQRKMRIMSKGITVLAIGIGVAVIIIGYYAKFSLYQNFLFALALSVSVVPEGLPAAMSVALSLGMKRLLKKNVLVRKLSSVETLGSVTTICSDKTGTITKNELTVTRIFIDNLNLEISGKGYAPEGTFFLNGKEINPKNIISLEMLFKIGLLCNSAELVNKEGHYSILGDPTEGAIIVAGMKYEKIAGRFSDKGEKKIGEIPFYSERMRMSVIYEGEKTVSYVKGSPEIILSFCKKKLVQGIASEMEEADKESIRRAYSEMSEEALRVLAFAYRDLDGVSKNNYQSEAEKDLVWVGMMAMIDPPRKDVEKAIAECRKMGIRILMITGDYEITARAIAKNIGLINQSDISEKENLVISGKNLDLLNDSEIFKKIKEGVCVFARIMPEQKLRIARILKDNNETIAMTGDGVNDAPALKKADVGVAMGIAGSDVSKEAADMILTDDDFSSILKGIKEGRTIFQNIKKFVYYVFTSNVSEFFTVVIGVVLGIPAPLTAIQILAIDLGTDIFPSLSLGVEPPEPELGKKLSSPQRDGILGFRGFRRLIYNGVIMATGAVVTFIWSMMRGGWSFGSVIDEGNPLYIKSTAAAYSVLAMTQMANLMQARSEKISVFKLGFLKNKHAIASIFISIIILLCFMYIPMVQKNLHLAPIDFIDWMMVAIWSLIVFFFEEARKEENKNRN